MAAPERSRRSTATGRPDSATTDTGTPATGTSATGRSATGRSATGTSATGTSATGTSADTTDTLSYEQARDELGDLVRQLESGGTGLEESLRLWERGEYLVGVCQQWLDGARVRLEQTGTNRS